MSGVKFPKNHASGVKTPTHFMRLIGTDKSVPFQNSGSYGVFPQPVKPKAIDGRFCGRTKQAAEELV
ncbi:MAG: hypothetical protein WBE41_25680 [Terracidiphilus sp.]